MHPVTQELGSQQCEELPCGVEYRLFLEKNEFLI
jgi:hypothetical protein